MISVALKWNDQALQRLEEAKKDALFRASAHLRERAVQRTPVETGHLRNSAKNTVSGDQAAVSYNTPYAARQHEELGWQHTDGEAKFLENAMRAERDNIRKIIGDRIGRELK